MEPPSRYWMVSELKPTTMGDVCDGIITGERRLGKLSMATRIT